MRKIAVLILFVCFVVGGCVAPVQAATAAHRVTAGQAAPPDSQIEATIRTKLAKSKIGKDGFHFHVQHGVVTWEGSTNVVQHKGAATRMAHSSGAVGVVNNIQVSAAGRAKASAALRKAFVQQH